MAEQYTRVNLTAPGVQLEGMARTTIGVADKGRGKWSIYSASTELGKGVLVATTVDGRRKVYFIPIDKVDHVELSEEHAERLLKALEAAKK